MPTDSAVPPVSYLEKCQLVSRAYLGAAVYDDSESSGYFMCNPDKLYLYAAFGVPVVATNFPSLSSVVLRHALGECCDSRQPRALADAIVALVEGDPGLAARRESALRAFRQELHFEKECRMLAEAIRGLP